MNEILSNFANDLYDVCVCVCVSLYLCVIR